MEEGCLRDRQKERGRERGAKEEGEGRQAKCAQYSFKLTEAVCVLVYTSLRSSHSLSFSLSLLSLSFSLSCFSLSFSVSIQTVCSFQQQDEEDTGERLGRGKKGETVINTRQSGTERKQDVQRVKEGDRGDLAFQSDQKRRSCKKNNRGMQREKEALLLKGI